MDRFSLDSRRLAQIRQNRIQGFDPYGTILKRQRFRLWPGIEIFISIWKGFNLSNVQ